MPNCEHCEGCRCEEVQAQELWDWIERLIVGLPDSEYQRARWSPMSEADLGLIYRDHLRTVMALEEVG